LSTFDLPITGRPWQVQAAKDNIKGPLETYRNWWNVVAIDWLRS